MYRRSRNAAGGERLQRQRGVLMDVDALSCCSRRRRKWTSADRRLSEADVIGLITKPDVTMNSATTATASTKMRTYRDYSATSTKWAAIARTTVMAAAEMAATIRLRDGFRGRCLMRPRDTSTAGQRRVVRWPSGSNSRLRRWQKHRVFLSLGRPPDIIHSPLPIPVPSTRKHRLPRTTSIGASQDGGMTATFPFLSPFSSRSPSPSAVPCPLSSSSQLDPPSTQPTF